ncbi:MAG: cyclic nucleotide-binding domain-containing protein [Desulfomonilaceae bacterium]|nr:cyclic nucleotide-binding domain-containing protein [Desulfomonilaceae bacterium]
MFLPKIDVFKDLRQEAINEISEIAIEESYQKDAVLFSAGDPAEHFYILVEGNVELAVGDAASSRYAVNRIGESFGWSSVVGRSGYAARAQCVAPSRILKIRSSDLEKVFDAHARSGRVFYRRLAEALGQRWVDLHRTFMSELSEVRPTSYGSRQTSGTGED